MGRIWGIPSRLALSTTSTVYRAFRAVRPDPGQHFIGGAMVVRAMARRHEEYTEDIVIRQVCSALSGMEVDAGMEVEAFQQQWLPAGGQCGRHVEGAAPVSARGERCCRDNGKDDTRTY
jgi:hypothetical protein